jgi:hypothetical protein
VIATTKVLGGRESGFRNRVHYDPQGSNGPQRAQRAHAGRGGAVVRLPVAGPPPRPLDRLESRIEGGKLQVQYQDFVLGTPDRVPA